MSLLCHLIFFDCLWSCHFFLACKQHPRCRPYIGTEIFHEFRLYLSNEASVYYCSSWIFYLSLKVGLSFLVSLKDVHLWQYSKQITSGWKTAWDSYPKKKFSTLLGIRILFTAYQSQSKVLIFRAVVYILRLFLEIQDELSFYLEYS